MTVHKVLLLCSVYKPNIGGVETVIEQLCQHYRECGVETVILTKRYPFNLSDREVFQQTSVFRFDRPQHLSDVPPTMKKILHYEAELKADVVHLIGIRRPMPIIAYQLSQRWRVPYVVTLSGGDIPNEGDPNSAVLWNEAGGMVEPYVSQSHAITVFSHATKLLAQKFLQKGDHAQVVYAGVDLDRVQKSQPVSMPHPFFFSARRLSYPKGIDILLAAFAQVVRQYPDIDLVIAGDGEERETLKRQASDLGIQNRTVFLGEIPLDRVYGLMKTAIAHFCPSRAESGGMVNIEAQAAGCLAVGSSAGGIGEYITEGVTGLLHTSESIEALAQTMRYVLDPPNQSTVELIKHNALAAIGTFLWKHCAGSFLTLYDNLL